MPGIVWIWCYDPPEAKNGILIPDTVARDDPFDMGQVIASGMDDLIQGSHVIHKPFSGYSREGFEYKGWKPRRIRSFGCKSDLVARPQRYDVSHTIMATLEDSKIKPYGQNLLIKRDAPPVKTDGGIFIDKEYATRPCTGIVVAIGSGVDREFLPVHVGERVAYPPFACYDIGTDEDLALIHQDGVEGVL